MNWGGNEIKINGKWFNYLRFSDGIVLIGESIEEVTKMLQWVCEEMGSETNFI